MACQIGARYGQRMSTSPVVVSLLQSDSLPVSAGSCVLVLPVSYLGSGRIHSEVNVQSSLISLSNKTLVPSG